MQVLRQDTADRLARHPRASLRAGLPVRGRTQTGTRRRGGFTLIELLVVIAVIMILAALSMPTLTKALDQAIRAQCRNNLRQIGEGLFLYATDWGDYFPANRKPHPGRGDDDLSPLYNGEFCADLNVFACPGTNDSPATADDLRFKRTELQPGGRPGQLSYEYLGEINPGLHFASRDINATIAWLAHDDDGKNLNTTIDGDNHGSAGANMLFLDGHVRWFPAEGWSAIVWRGHNGVDGEWERCGAYQ